MLAESINQKKSVLAYTFSFCSIVSHALMVIAMKKDGATKVVDLPIDGREIPT